jgi:hypothetical protein
MRSRAEASEGKPAPFGPRVTATASASLSMPAASPRRQASPVDMTLTSARTTRRRRGATLAGLGSSCLDEDEKPAAVAKETAVRYIEAAAGTKTEARQEPSSDSRPASTARKVQWAPGGRARTAQAGRGQRSPLCWVPLRWWW